MIYDVIYPVHLIENLVFFNKQLHGFIISLKDKTTTLLKQRIKTISEVFRSEIQINPKINLVKKGSKNESCCNVAVTTSQSCSNATATACQSLIRQIAKTIKNQN